MEAQGYAAHSATSPLEPFTFQRRIPRPDDVFIDIKYCGICHSDIHVVKNEFGGYPAHYPLVPGHEITGIVREVGKNVKTFKAGDRVGVGCIIDKKDGVSSNLLQYSGGAIFTYSWADRDGTFTQGGYANIIVAPEAFVLRIPETIPLDTAAPLLCAGITVYSPLKHWNAGPGKKVAVIGMGGLGHMAVKIGHALGAEITVLSQTLSKKADGLEFGAKNYLALSDPETYKSIGNTFDMILATVATPQMDWEKIIQSLKNEGTLVIVGAQSGSISLPITQLIFGRRSVAGSAIGDLAETQEMLDFCAKHGIASTIEKIPIQDVNKAFERVEKSAVRYRFVIDNSTLAPPAKSA